MQKFDATIAWQRGGQPFVDNRYSRSHAWLFDGGAQVSASSSPLSVPVPMSDPAAVDPEEALVAAVSSCHMLFFLSIARKRGMVVDSYSDTASGTLSANSAGKLAMTAIALRPVVVFAGERQPDPAQLSDIHHAAHDQCYIANSITATVSIEGMD